VALAIAVVKASLVILFFMHVKYSSRLTKMTVGAGLFWLIILLFMTMTDLLTRNMMGVPGR
jgi:cytochrome c oxidase subunit 4